VATLARKYLRPDDVVGIVSHKRIGVLLVDTLPESARMVFNRLRWQIAAMAYTPIEGVTIGVTVSISFCRIDGNIKADQVYDECEKALDGLRLESANAMLDVGA
jgi:GGDEF domain-containing protein